MSVSNKSFIECKEIQSRVKSICDAFYNAHSSELKCDKNGEEIVTRGFVRNMFNKVREEYTSTIIVPQYTGLDLWNICCVAEVMIEICGRYGTIPNDVLLSVITGVSNYLFKKILNTSETDVIARMDLEYDQDYKLYFKKVYNVDKTRTIFDAVKIGANIEHAYPIYCLLQQIRNFEEDDRIERSKLGDLAKLNAPKSIGGFGYAKPEIMVDNRQLIIGDEMKLLNTYAFSQKRINDVKVDKQELKLEAIDLFKEERENGK